MSIDIMNRLWWRTDLSMVEKVVALALADSASDEGLCWPAIATVAVKCGCSDKSVKRAVRALCGKGLLRRHERPNRSSYYMFNLDALPVIQRQKREKEAGPVELDLWGDTQSPVKADGGHTVPPRGTESPLTGDTQSPRTIIEPSDEPSELFGDLRSPAEPLIPFIEREWKRLVDEHPGIAAIRKIDDGLAHTIKLRAQQHAVDGQTPTEVWGELFKAVRESVFLQGRVAPGPGRTKPFRLSLSWAAGASNFRDIIGRGKYHGTVDRSRVDERDGRLRGPSEIATGRAIARGRARRALRDGGRDPLGSHP